MPVRRRRLRWIVVAILIVLGGAWLGRGWWLEPWIASRVAAALSRTLGGPVTIATMRGSWWRSVSVSGVAATALTATPLRSLHLDQVEVSYGLGIITGNLQHLRTVTVRGAEVEIDLRQRPAAAPSDTWAPFLAQVPQPLPEIRVDGRWLLRLDAGDISCQGVAIIASGQRIALAATGVDVPWLNGTRDLSLSLRVGEGGQLELAEAVEVAGLGIVDSLSLRADDEAQGFALAAAIADGQLAVAVQPDEWSVTLDDLALNRFPADLRWTVPSTLQGRVSARLRGGAGPLRIDAEVEDIAWAAFRIAHGSAAGTWHQGELTIPALELDSGDGIHVQGRDLRLGADGTRGGTVQVDAQDLRPLLHRLNVVTTLPSGALAAEVHARADGDGIHIDALTMQAPGQEVIGTGRWSGPDDQQWLFAGSLRSDLDTLNPYLPEIVLAGTVRGDLTLAGVGKDWAQIDVAFTGSGHELTIGSLALPAATVDIRGRDRRLTVDAMATVRDTVVALAGSAELTADGAVTVIIPGLAVARGDLVLSNVDTIRARWKAPEWAVEPARFTGLGGDVVLGGSGHGDQVEVALSAENLDLGRLRDLGLQQDIRGSIDVALTMQGDIAHPDLSLRTTTREVTVAGVPGQWTAALRQDEDGIHIDEAWLTVAHMAEVRLAGVWPIRVGSTGLTATGTLGSGAKLTTTIASLDRWFGDLFTSGALSCTASIVPDANGSPELQARLAITDARVALADPFALVRQRAEPPPIDLDVEVRADMQRGQVQLAAVIGGDTVARGDLTADWQAGFRHAPLSGMLRIDALNLASFASISSQIVRLQGIINGSLRLGGTVDDPQPHGRLHVSDAEFKLNADVPTIAAAAGQLDVVSAETIEFSLTAEMGYAPVGATGSLTFIAGKPHVDLRVTADDALLIQNRDLRIHATTTDLRLHGPLTALRSEGTIIINDGLWSRPIDLIGTGASRASVEDGRLELFSLREPPLSNMVFDLRIRTDPRSGSGLRLGNNLINADLRVDLHLGGTGRSPEPNGFIVSQNARVSLPFSILNIERAELAFPDGDPFRPTLDLTGTSQVRQWRIAVQARGPIDDIVIEASAPGVSTEDAVMLLSTGATRTELTDPDGQRAMLSRVGTFVGMELVRTIRGPDDPDASDTLLDRWSLEFGREISRDGRETIDAEIRLNPFIQRHGWILYGQRDRFDEYNIGVTLRLRLGGNAP